MLAYFFLQPASLASTQLSLSRYVTDKYFPDSYSSHHLTTTPLIPPLNPAPAYAYISEPNIANTTVNILEVSWRTSVPKILLCGHLTSSKPTLRLGQPSGWVVHRGAPASSRLRAVPSSADATQRSRDEIQPFPLAPSWNSFFSPFAHLFRQARPSPASSVRKIITAHRGMPTHCSIFCSSNGGGGDYSSR